jgi:hypothetical protein
MAIRVQVGSDGNSVISDPARPTSREVAPEQAQAQVRMQQGAVRVTVNSETGETRYEQSRPREYRATPVQHAGGATVRGENGMPTTLALATPGAVVNIPGLGETSVQAAMTMGYVQARLGGGYELVGQPMAEQPEQSMRQPRAAETKREQEAVGNPDDVRGVPPTSVASDALLRTLEANTPVALEGIITSMVHGTKPEALIQDIARQLGDEGMSGKISAMHGEFLASGQAALRNVGVVNPAEFEMWAKQNHAEKAADAVRDLVIGKSVGKLQALGRDFVEQSNNRLAMILQSKGIDSKIEDGTVYLSRKALGLEPSPKRGDFGGSPWISVSEAQREGITFDR